MLRISAFTLAAYELVKALGLAALVGAERVVPGAQHTATDLVQRDICPE
jgi:hypothetical protein